MDDLAPQTPSEGSESAFDAASEQLDTASGRKAAYAKEGGYGANMALSLVFLAAIFGSAVMAVWLCARPGAVVLLGWVAKSSRTVLRRSTTRPTARPVPLPVDTSLAARRQPAKSPARLAS